MNILFVFIFLGVFISFIICLIRPKYRSKKYLLGSLITLIVSFILFGITTPETVMTSKETKEKQEKLEKKSDERKVKEQEAREKKVAEEKAKQEKEAREKREIEEQQARERSAREEQARQTEQNRQQATQVENRENTTNGITGYCKDGTPASGNPSARGKANSCYGHGGWVR
ncbi:hypothetical protein JNUCC83_12125 [Vagococcus sp. JNUCC 83]